MFCLARQGFRQVPPIQLTFCSGSNLLSSTSTQAYLPLLRPLPPFPLPLLLADLVIWIKATKILLVLLEIFSIIQKS
jgi:hypothetical protein